ncbi:MAG: ATP-binding protein, partial [Photobacterium aquimaris]|nr:ATP-binding protein [Photobacterium aquimaris]
ATPALLAFDLVGVQPMTGPTGLIFAMKSKYSTQGGTEALHNEADTGFSGTANGSATDSDNPFAGDSADADAIDDYTPGSAMTTATAEALGNTGNAFGEMAFSIDKTTVTAKSRALKAQYTVELAQDLKAVHGLSAETELANILSTEILAEMNREIIRNINLNSVTSTLASGEFDATDTADTGGARWLVERIKGMVFAMEKEANIIATSTRRGKGNWAIVSHGVAAALNAAGMMDTTLGLSGPANFDSDATGSLLAGTLTGGMKVYIDPYAAVDYYTIGYKGSNPYDAGMFYCPYVPLSMMKTIGENDFQPKIGFKTRYGLADNPFVTAGAGNNVYYRKRKVVNL